MKKKIILLLVLSVFGVVSLLAYRISIKASKKLEAEDLLSSVPPIRLLDLDSTSVVLNKPVHSRSMVLVYFNPTCEHCQYEAEIIRDNIDQFNHTDIVMLSDESIPMIKKFAADHHLEDQPGVRFFKIDPNIVFSTFGKYSVPTILIYDQNGHLAKRFDGETKIEAILNHL